MVLEIGAGYGYSAAVMAHIAQAVVALESDEIMANDAQTALSDEGADNVIVQTGALDAGASEHGPYDVIVLQGGVETVPARITDQCASRVKLMAS